MSKLIVSGHSFGGITALGATCEDNRVKAVVALDPWFFPHFKELNASKFKIRCANQSSCLIVTEGYYSYNADRYEAFEDYKMKMNFSTFLQNSVNKGKQAHYTLKRCGHANQMDASVLSPLEVYL